MLVVGLYCFLDFFQDPRLMVVRTHTGPASMMIYVFIYIIIWFMVGFNIRFVRMLIVEMSLARDTLLSSLDCTLAKYINVPRWSSIIHVCVLPKRLQITSLL